MEFNAAMRVVGTLLGHIFYRNAGREIYACYLARLTKGGWLLVKAVKEFFLGEKFRDKFIVN